MKEKAWQGGAGRERRERISSRLHTVSAGPNTGLEQNVGLELTTTRSRVIRSADWASQAPHHLHFKNEK